MLNATWVFQSGLPFTPVVGRYYVPVLTSKTEEVYYYESFIYGEKNSERARYYHRLDLGIHYTTYTKRGNKAQWSLVVYNAYNRKNPYSYFFTHDVNDESNLVPNPFFENVEPFSLYQVSFFPILPTISYKVHFEDLKGRKNRKTKVIEIEEPKPGQKRSWLYFNE